MYPRRKYVTSMPSTTKPSGSCPVGVKIRIFLYFFVLVAAFTMLISMQSTAHDGALGSLHSPPIFSKLSVSSPTSTSSISSTTSLSSSPNTTATVEKPKPNRNLLSEKVKEWSANIVNKDPWYPFTRTHSSKSFYKPDCPLIPDKATYPKSWPIKELLDNWNTDSTDIPPFHYDSICHFDFRNETELQMSYKYREMELPYVMRNIPQLDEVVEKWSNVDYLAKKLGVNTPYGTETSANNHFMYWTNRRKWLRGPDGKQKRWEPPTGHKEETFEEWLKVAVKGQNISLEDRVHEYFRVTNNKEPEWLFSELPFFRPIASLMIVDPRQQMGIHCRFGMRSVIAEAHFDGSNNAVVMLGGLRRWILTHPNQCVNMHMLPRDHPSGRHSQVDWSKPDYDKYPNFHKVMANEVILQPGDFLYVPTYWIHYITSLNVNYQCNTRSGRFLDYDEHIKRCGF